MPVGSLLGSARRRLSRAAARVGQIAIRPLDTGPSASAETARVAVVIPVFNAMPYLQQLLDSLAQQDLSPELFEVIAVDDGSTDGSGKVLERFAAAHPNVRLIRQRNSGWPGQPRNAGIEASRGDYVFFADADDLLAPEALRAMLDFADRHAVDVLVPRMAGLSGRRVNHSLFAQTHIDAPLRQVFGTLSPQKLIRRELLEAQGLRFPEGRVRLEDGMFITRCYLAAQRVSVLAEHDYYYLRARQDGSNISARSTVPEDYTNSVRIIARDILDRCSDPGLAEQLVLDLYRRKILRVYVPARYQAMSPRRRSRWVSAHEQFAREFVPPQLDEHLEFPFGDRSRLLRQGDPVPLLEYAKAESVLRQSCALAVPENGCPPPAL